MGVDPLRSLVADATGWLKLRRRDLLIVSLLWLAAAIIVFLLADKHVTPRRYQDEFFYWALAKSLAAGDGLTWRGAHVDLRSFLYPVFIAPVFKLSSNVSTQYSLVHAFNSLAITAVVFPTFLAARPLAGRRFALLAALFAVCVPAINYAGIIGTESLGYFLCTVAFAAILLACWRPRARNGVIALAAILLAALTRTQFVILLPILISTVVLTAAAQGRAGWREYVREQRFLLWVLGATTLLALLAIAVQGDKVVGLYAAAFHGAPLRLSELWFWFRSFAADVYLVCGILPAIATFALIGARENRRDRYIVVLLALTFSAVFAFVLQTTWFSATNVFHWRENHVFYERYVFYLAPLFFIGGAVSIGRVSMRAAAVSIAVGAVIVAGFQPETVQVPFSYDAFGLAYIGFLFDAHESWGPHVGLLLAGLTALMGACYLIALLPDRHKEISKYGKALCIVVPLFVLVLSGAKSWSYAWLYSEDSFAREPSPPGFAQAAADGPIGLLLANTLEPLQGFQAEFWNPKITRAYVNPAPPINSSTVFRPNCAFVWDKSGRLLPGGCGALPRWWYVSSQDLTVTFRDQPKTIRPVDRSRSNVLIESGGPPRLLAMARGVDRRTHRITENELSVWSFLDKPGQLRVVFSSVGSAASVELPGGAKSTVVPKTNRVVVQQLAARQQVSKFKYAQTKKQPGIVRVQLIEVREGNGPWRKIN